MRRRKKKFLKENIFLLMSVLANLESIATAAQKNFLDEPLVNVCQTMYAHLDFYQLSYARVDVH